MVVQKWAKRNSFFNFFTPPKVENKELDVKVATLLEAHFDIGLHFKETFIPKAVVFFMSEESGDKSEKKDEVKIKVKKVKEEKAEEPTRSETVVDDNQNRINEESKKTDEEDEIKSDQEVKV